MLAKYIIWPGERIFHYLHWRRSLVIPRFCGLDPIVLASFPGESCNPTCDSDWLLGTWAVFQAHSLFTSWNNKCFCICGREKFTQPISRESLLEEIICELDLRFQGPVGVEIYIVRLEKHWHFHFVCLSVWYHQKKKTKNSILGMGQSFWINVKYKGIRQKHHLN